MQSLAHQFLEFCRSKPADEGFDPWDSDNCAGAQFLREAGYPLASCGIWFWTDTRLLTHPLPSEMGEAIDWAADQIELGGRDRVRFSALATRLEAALTEQVS